MEVKAATKKLSKVLSDEDLLQKNYGKLLSKKIKLRIVEFYKAESLVEISHLPPPRLHLLQGTREFTVDISRNWRIVFEAYNEEGNVTIKKNDARIIKITRIEDYH